MNDCEPKQSKSPLVCVPFLRTESLKGKFMLIIESGESGETRVEVRTTERQVSLLGYGNH